MTYINNARIRDLTADNIDVDTLEIDGAIILDGTILTPKYLLNSIIVAGFSTNPSDFALSTSDAEMCSVTITPNGGKVVVIVSIAGHASGDTGVRLQVRKNGVSQIDEEVVTVLGGKFGNGTLVWVDTSPGSSANTYSCYARKTSGSASIDHIFSSVIAENHKNA